MKHHHRESFPPVKLSLLTTINIVGGLLFGYNTGSIGPSIPPLCYSFFKGECSEGNQALISSSLLLGAMLGSIAGGAICDRWGRKFGLWIGSILTICGALSQAFSVDFNFLLILRVLLGFGVGLTGVVCPLYVSEMSSYEHEERQGFLGTLFQLAITVGIVLALLLGLIIRSDNMHKSIQWRLIIGTGVLPGILLLCIGIVMRESTHWERTLMDNNESMTSILGDNHKKRCCDIFSSAYLPQLFIGVVLAACLQLTGINVVMFFAPNILANVDSIKGNVQMQMVVHLCVGIWNSITTIVAVVMVERVGRKPLMIVGTLILTVANFIIASSKFFEGDTNTAVVLIGLALFLLGFEMGPGCLFWVLVNELFPMDIRDNASSIINTLQWGFNLLITSVAPLMLRNIGVNTFFIYGGVGIIVLIILQVYLKETAKKEDKYDVYM
jgi:SP family arabinose:H+ symporter-like MFS transporter